MRDDRKPPLLNRGKKTEKRDRKSILVGDSLMAAARGRWIFTHDLFPLFSIYIISEHIEERAGGRRRNKEGEKIEKVWEARMSPTETADYTQTWALHWSIPHQRGSARSGRHLFVEQWKEEKEAMGEGKAEGANKRKERNEPLWSGQQQVMHWGEQREEAQHSHSLPPSRHPGRWQGNVIFYPFSHSRIFSKFYYHALESLNHFLDVFLLFLVIFFDLMSPFLCILFCFTLELRQ